RRVEFGAAASSTSRGVVDEDSHSRHAGGTRLKNHSEYIDERFQGLGPSVEQAQEGVTRSPPVPKVAFIRDAPNRPSPTPSPSPGRSSSLQVVTNESLHCQQRA
ncbi:unnamed protein product, partial [Amoebophrya sp. A25]